MWDVDQLAEIPVIADRLQAQGDPLGEWLAVRVRVDAGGLARPERQILRSRARALRGRLGSRLVLADDPALGRPHVVRERGLIADIQLARATPDRLAALLGRPDAPFVLRLQLRGDANRLRACVALLLGDDASRLGRTPISLRQLELEPEPEGTGEQLFTELSERRDALGTRLISLFTLGVDARVIPLPFASAALDRGEQPWTPTRRADLGRALASAEPNDRRRALERLHEHGRDAGQLGAALLRIIEHEGEPSVRAAAFEVVAGLGSLAHPIIAVAADFARGREDPQLQAWLQAVRSQFDANSEPAYERGPQPGEKPRAS
ncbi:hypothetical protein DB30_03075 [Enhygromyxa salina]|uniref:HEAT repeat protein n=1 Tax=Enhygromyxa salina TaxID=215803 RepID=A0A0C1ZJC2_9BACT|nr:hypothetical protein [Enhygromyxa salina]KIG17594.1 hypothetical protein DB30_03075 [Enhygromyxa salina]